MNRFELMVIVVLKKIVRIVNIIFKNSNHLKNAGNFVITYSPNHQVLSEFHT